MKKQTIELQANLESSQCNEYLHAIRQTLEIIGGKWKVPLLWLLWQRTKRFNELRQGLPTITQHMLTASLRELEADGLVSRVVYAEVPPRVEYSLTEKGRSLYEVFVALGNWGRDQG